MKTAIQGMVGSFHHEAATKMLGQDIQIVPCPTFRHVFKTVQDGTADQGVVAIENNLHGPINAVYRLLAQSPVWVIGEVTLHINQYLIAAQDRPLASIKTVMSQAPALAQCELWLEEHLPEAHIEETKDTTASVEFVVNHADQQLAAVAGKGAAAQYGGTILAGPINDEKHNYTRFFLISKDKAHLPGATKTSIILETNHQPGALYKALGAFADANINLSKLDSHPIASDKQHYAFYIDFEAGLNEELEHAIFDVLKNQGCKITVLGSYKSQELTTS